MLQLAVFDYVPECEYNGDPEGDLLPGVRGQTEHQHRQARHHHARENDVVHVVQRLPTYPEINKYKYFKI